MELEKCAETTSQAGSIASVNESNNETTKGATSGTDFARVIT